LGVVSQSPLDHSLGALFCHYGWPLGAGVQTAVDSLEDEATVADEPVDVVVLENAAAGTGDQRQHFKDSPRVRLEGFYNFLGTNERGTFFSVVRLRMACCLNDARPSMVVCVAKRGPKVNPGDWVTVQGRVDFYKANDGYKPAMRVAQVKPTKMPAVPYLK
jgi:uncharacterized membrane protein YcgQ (UPF0703/DUF1980 family)